jgi:hypothetical protein
LALSGLIEDPVNPYTGNLITSDAKNTPSSVIITTSHKWDVSENNGAVFDTSDGEWYAVEKDIFDVNNWTKIDNCEK